MCSLTRKGEKTQNPIIKKTKTKTSDARNDVPTNWWSANSWEIAAPPYQLPPVSLFSMTPHALACSFGQFGSALLAVLFQFLLDLRLNHWQGNAKSQRSLTQGKHYSIWRNDQNQCAMVMDGNYISHVSESQECIYW